MFNEAVGIWNSFYSTAMKLPFIFYFILVAVYFWINGAAHFPEWNSTYGTVILPYLVMMIAFVLWAKTKADRRIEISTSLGIPAFAMSFIVTWIIVSLLVSFGIFAIPFFPKEILFQTIIINIFVVSVAEEVMFRGVLLEAFGKLGVFISAFLFAMWHMYAYNVIWYEGLELASFTGLVLAFVFGIILGFVALKKEWGLPATIGIHAAYNLVIVGALAIL